LVVTTGEKNILVSMMRMMMVHLVEILHRILVEAAIMMHQLVGHLVAILHRRLVEAATTMMDAAQLVAVVVLDS